MIVLPLSGLLLEWSHLKLFEIGVQQTWMHQTVNRLLLEWISHVRVEVVIAIAIRVKTCGLVYGLRCVLSCEVVWLKSQLRVVIQCSLSVWTIIASILLPWHFDIKCLISASNFVHFAMGLVHIFGRARVLRVPILALRIAVKTAFKRANILLLVVSWHKGESFLFNLSRCLLLMS